MEKTLIFVLGVWNRIAFFVMKIRILLADDNQLFRELLAERFLKTTDMEVVAEAEDSEDVMQKVVLLQPDIVLLEVASPCYNGVELSKMISKTNPLTKVVALTSTLEKQLVKDLFEASVWGYLLKKCTFEQLTISISHISIGSKQVSEDVQSLLIESYLDKVTMGGMAVLTKRELDVMVLLAEGKSIKEIAETFFISIKTVGSHKKNIFEKMGFENISQLIRFALSHGIVS